MKRRSLSLSAGGFILAAAGASAAASAEEARPHKIAVHVGGGDPGLMATALHNIANAIDTYAARGEKLLIELVANGPGYTMLRADTSPVKELFAETRGKYPQAVFSACQISRKGAAAAEHKSIGDIPQLAGVTDVPAGIVRLNELQEDGYSYIRV